MPLCLTLSSAANVPDFIVHDARQLPMRKTGLCLDGHLLINARAFQ